MTTYPFFLRIKQRVEKEDSKRGKSTGENNIIFFFFLRILVPAWQVWEHENL